jgi:NitT/TauT family transport system substrate-binding protein
VFRSIPAALAFTSLLVFLFHAEAANAQQRISVRAAYVPAVPGLAAWVAQDKGFFAEQGLEVSFVPVQNISLVPSAIGKQLDIGMVTVVELIKATAGGLNIAAVAGGHLEIEGSTTNILIARKDSGVKNIKDIGGKIVATPTVGAILHVALLHWMMKEGIDVNSIRAVEVPFPNMPDQMAAGRIDIAVAAQPFADRMIEAGNVSLGNQLLQVASPVLATLWISDRAWAEQNKPVIAKWTAALRQAKDFIAKNPREAREVLAKYTKLPAPVVQTISLPHFETNLAAKEIDVWVKVLVELKQLEKPVDASKLLVTAQ